MQRSHDRRVKAAPSSESGRFRSFLVSRLTDPPAIERQQLELLAGQLKKDGVTVAFFSIIIALLLGTDILGVLDGWSLPNVWVWCSLFLVWSPAMVLSGRILARRLDQAKGLAGCRAIATVMYCVNAAVWVSLLLLLPNDSPRDAVLFVALVLAGHIMTYMVNLSPHLLVMIAALTVALSGIELALLARYDPLSQMLTVIYAPFCLVVLMLGRDSSLRLGANLRRAEVLSELGQQLLIAREAAEAEGAAKSRFFATMSHELRTPLNAIIGFSELMAQEIMGKHAVPIYKTYATDIETSGRDLLGIVENLLEYSSSKPEEITIALQPLSLAEILEDVRFDISPVALEKQISLRLSCGDQGAISAAPLRLKQVMGHLGTRAIVASPASGEVWISVDKAGESAQVAISFSGRLSKDEISSVSSPFREGDNTELASDSSFGQNLAMNRSRTVIERHGGSLAIDTGIPDRTRFVVTMPQCVTATGEKLRMSA